MTPSPPAPTPFPAMRRPLVAILRGLRPEEAPGVVGALIEGGFTAIEVPLNSPDPLRSVEIAAGLAPPGVLIGAGTVLDAEAVARVHAAGGRLVVSPNVDPAVIAAARARGMVAMPGVFTPTEALLAAAAGASVLKFFPASVLGPGGIAAVRAVLPPGLPTAAVGGVSERDFSGYLRAGVAVFGLGSSLYAPGMGAAQVAARARAAIEAYDAAASSPG